MASTLLAGSVEKLWEALTTLRRYCCSSYEAYACDIYQCTICTAKKLMSINLSVVYSDKLSLKICIMKNKE